MPSFRDASQHFPALLIDAASSLIQVGLLQRDGTAAWQTSEAEAGIAVFEATRNFGCEIGDIGAFIFCEGPGSILGIRTVAMAIRTWCVLQPRPVFAYSSLALVAHALGREDVQVIADARRDSWHVFRIGGRLARVPARELAGELLMPEGFRNWTPLPAAARTTPYRLAKLLPAVWDVDLLRPTDAPDAFLHEEPSYVAWTPQIHRAPGET